MAQIAMQRYPTSWQDCWSIPCILGCTIRTTTYINCPNPWSPPTLLLIFLPRLPRGWMPSEQFNGQIRSIYHHECHGQNTVIIFAHQGHPLDSKGLWMECLAWIAIWCDHDCILGKTNYARRSGHEHDHGWLKETPNATVCGSMRFYWISFTRITQQSSVVSSLKTRCEKTTTNLEWWIWLQHLVVNLMSGFYQALLYTSCCWEPLLQASAPKMLRKAEPPNCTCDRPSSRAFSRATRMVGLDWTSPYYYASNKNRFLGFLRFPFTRITVKGTHKCNHISTCICPSLQSAIVYQHFMQTKETTSQSAIMGQKQFCFHVVKKQHQHQHRH